MGDAIAAIAAKNKLERVSAYRQLQGTSHQLYQLSGRTLDEFDLPHAANVRPTNQTESRIVVADVERGTETAYMVDRTTGRRLAILPAECTTVPLLTLMLDQGSIGTAGAAFIIFPSGQDAPPQVRQDPQDHQGLEERREALHGFNFLRFVSCGQRTCTA